MLDLESVRLFVLAAEYGNFSRAAEAAGTVQPVVSQRIKALEAAVGRKLLDRTPRFVRLTDAGGTFLTHARTLLAAHDAALMQEDTAVPVALGISDHALGTRFDTVLARMRGALPASTAITVSLGQSAVVRAMFDSATVDLAIIRRETGGDGGEVLGRDALEWRVAPDWRRPDGPLPLVLLPAPCAVRAVALKALERAGIAARESFTGGSCLALLAAVKAGLGVAPLGGLAGGELAVAPLGLGLPPLPGSDIVMLARTPNPALGVAARALAASVRDTLPHRLPAR